MAPKYISMLLLAILVAVATVSADEATSSRPSYRRPLPPLPCVPGRQRPSWLPPCSPPPPQPAECYTSLSGLTPCADFLTNPDVAAPAAACCDGLASLVGDAPICLCHVVNGDLNKLLPAPMLRLRMVQLRRMCAVGFPRATLRECIRGHAPPMNPPSTPPPPTPEPTPAASPPAASPPESTPTPPAASPPGSPSTPPPESPSTPPPTPAATPPESPSAPAASSPSPSPSP